MSYKGHLVCHTCRLVLTLGKLGRDEEGNPTHFRAVDPDELGRIALAFIAAHLKHDPVCLGDTRMEMGEEEWNAYDLLTEKRPLAWAERESPVQLAGVSFWKIPLEPLHERDERLRREAGPENLGEESEDD